LCETWKIIPPKAALVSKIPSMACDAFDIARHQSTIDFVFSNGQKVFKGLQASLGKFVIFQGMDIRTVGK
jgi:hypothetical protein